MKVQSSEIKNLLQITGFLEPNNSRSNSLTIFSPQRCGLFVFSLIFNDTEVAFRFDDNITSENRTLVFSARIL